MFNGKHLVVALTMVLLIGSLLIVSSIYSNTLQNHQKSDVTIGLKGHLTAKLYDSDGNLKKMIEKNNALTHWGKNKIIADLFHTDMPGSSIKQGPSTVTRMFVYYNGGQVQCNRVELVGIDPTPGCEMTIKTVTEEKKWKVEDLPEEIQEDADPEKIQPSYFVKAVFTATMDAGTPETSKNFESLSLIFSEASTKMNDPAFFRQFNIVEFTNGLNKNPEETLELTLEVTTQIASGSKYNQIEFTNANVGWIWLNNLMLSRTFDMPYIKFSDEPYSNHTTPIGAMSVESSGYFTCFMPNFHPYKFPNSTSYWMADESDEIGVCTDVHPMDYQIHSTVEVEVVPAKPGVSPGAYVKIKISIPGMSPVAINADENEKILYVRMFFATNALTSGESLGIEAPESDWHDVFKVVPENKIAFPSDPQETLELTITIGVI